MSSEKFSENNNYFGDKCSASCVKAGMTVLLFSLLGLSLLQQLSKQDHLQHLISYIVLRYTLSEQVELLQCNPCWKSLTEEIGAEKIFKLPISELFEHKCRYKIKANVVNNNFNEGHSQDNSQGKKPLPSPQGLGISSPITQLREISDTLKKLNESELLTRAKEYNNVFNFSIFKWENLQYRLVLSNSDDTAWADWDVVSNNPEKEKSNLLEHLTIDDVIKLSEYEYPEWNRVESIIKKNKINIPSFSQQFQIDHASVLIEIVILISIIYFWVFLVKQQRFFRSSRLVQSTLNSIHSLIDY